MSFPLFVAKKYISSKKRSFFSLISVITIAGIAIGVTVVVIALSILDGFDSVVRDKIVSLNSHILISGYNEKDLPDDQKIISKIEQVLGKDHNSTSKFISKNSIIRSDQRSEGISLIGVDAGSNNLGIDKFILQGTFLKENSIKSPSIVLGKKLAERLLVKLNDKITIFSLKKNELPSFNNPPAISQFYVGGIYESGMPEYDDLKAYISFNTAQTLFEMGGKISGYNIRLNNLSKIDSLNSELHDSFGYPYYVRTIFRQHQNIFTWIELQKEPIPIILGLIVLVAVFNIIGTMLMNILERTSQIGILKSLGANRKQILEIFFIQGLFLALIGITIGNILAFVLSKAQLEFNLIKLPDTVYFLSTAPIEINIFNYVLVSVTAFILSIASSLIPSIIASKINTISAIRFD